MPLNKHLSNLFAEEGLGVAILGGTGDLGFGLALRLANAGVDVVIGSRRHERALEAAERIKSLLPHASVEGKINREAVLNSEFVFFSVPYEGLKETANEVASFLQENSIVISCVVPFVDEQISAAEALAKILQPRVKVLSALHTVSAVLLSDLQKNVDSDTFIFGDDREAKKKLAKLLTKIATLRPVDGGALKNSKYAEALTRFLVGINKRYELSWAGVKITGLEDSQVMRRWET